MKNTDKCKMNTHFHKDKTFAKKKKYISLVHFVTFRI